MLEIRKSDVAVKRQSVEQADGNDVPPDHLLSGKSRGAFFPLLRLLGLLPLRRGRESVALLRQAVFREAVAPWTLVPRRRGPQIDLVAAHRRLLRHLVRQHAQTALGATSRISAQRGSESPKRRENKYILRWRKILSDELNFFIFNTHGDHTRSPL